MLVLRIDGVRIRPKRVLYFHKVFLLDEGEVGALWGRGLVHLSAPVVIVLWLSRMRSLLQDALFRREPLQFFILVLRLLRG